MAQDQSAKRLNLASRAVALAETYAQLIADMNQWAIEANTNYCGNFVQTEFDNTAVKQVTPGMLNVFRDNVIVRLNGQFLNSQFLDSAAADQTKQIITQLLP